MENDENIKDNNIIDNSELILKNGFQLDYAGQSLNNSKFINWKIDMFKKYGKDAKLFKCKNENILFYVSKKECESQLYTCKCPSCHESICYFCLKSMNEDYYGKCCIKGRTCYLILKSGFKFIETKYDFYENDYKEIRCLFLIPFLNLLILIAVFSSFLFYRMNDHSKENGYQYMYEDRLKEGDGYMLFIIIGINKAIALMLGICFTILFTYVIIIFFLISIIFKEYPSRYIIGVFYEGYRY